MLNIEGRKEGMGFYVAFNRSYRDEIKIPRTGKKFPSLLE